MKLTALLLPLLALPFAVGCSAQTDDAATADEALTAPAPIPAGKFDLYREAGYAPESDCVLTTKLEVKDLNAHLEEGFTGACPLEIAIQPNARDYRLTREGTSCGSTIYASEIRTGAEIRTLKLVDHRSRTCRDIQPAKIIVTETISNALGVMEITQYSNDNPKIEAESVIEGELASVMAIGGETTGFAVQTESGMVELILDPGERNQFVDGKRARVKGKKTTLTGVEIPLRPAFDVSAMLVCPNPGWINCMPGPGVRLSNLCASENRSWVQSNCDGVDYAD